MSDTKSVLDHHMQTLDAGDVDGLMEDYTEDSVFISNLGGAVKGLDGIRAVFSVSAGATTDFELLGEVIEGETAYVWWKAEGIAFGTDTFWIRDGKIITQTVGLHFG